MFPISHPRRDASPSRLDVGAQEDQATSLLSSATGWKEPALSQRPSYRDHHAGPHGVLEHMQTLGEKPAARVRQRGRPDASRRGTIADYFTPCLDPSGSGPDANGTARSPGTRSRRRQQRQQQRDQAEDQGDARRRLTTGDYDGLDLETNGNPPEPPSTRRSLALRSSKASVDAWQQHASHLDPDTSGVVSTGRRVKERAAKTRASHRVSLATAGWSPRTTSAASARSAGLKDLYPADTKHLYPTGATTGTLTTTSNTTTSTSNTSNATMPRMDPARLRQIVDAAKQHAHDMGTPDQATYVHEIYLRSLADPSLQDLLESILDQTATPQQMADYHSQVRTVKKRLRNAKKNRRAIPGTTPRLSGPIVAPNPLLTTTSSSIDKTHATTPPVAPAASLDHPRPRTTLFLRNHRGPSASKHGTNANTNASTNSTTDQPPARRSHRHSTRANASDADLAVNDAQPIHPDIITNVDSDSSLTDMTSNSDGEDDVTANEPPSGLANGIKTADTTGANSVHPTMAGKKRSAPPRARGGKKNSGSSHATQNGENGNGNDDPADRLIKDNRIQLSVAVIRGESYPDSYTRTKINPGESADAMVAHTRGPRRTRSTMQNDTADAAASRNDQDDGDGDAMMGEDPESSLSDPPSQTGGETPQPSNETLGRSKKALGKMPMTRHSTVKNNTGVDESAANVEETEDEADSDNNNFCEACGTIGMLICCDGCYYSFHESCLDTPISAPGVPPPDKWYCRQCAANRKTAAKSAAGASDKPARGLFGQLLAELESRNPANFVLPRDIREHFDGIPGGHLGALAEAMQHTKPKNRSGYDEIPDYTRLKDSKGNFILCYYCRGTSTGNRQIIGCDYCVHSWHLDCLNPPMCHPPTLFNNDGNRIRNWMCPLHIDHDLREISTQKLQEVTTAVTTEPDPRFGRAVSIRHPRHAEIVKPSMWRGVRNHGIIEVDDEDEDLDMTTADAGAIARAAARANGDEFYNETNLPGDKVYKLPVEGIKLDFIDRVKSTVARTGQIPAGIGQVPAFGRPRPAAPVAPAPVAARAAAPVAPAGLSGRPSEEREAALALLAMAREQPEAPMAADRAVDLVFSVIYDDQIPAAAQDTAAGNEAARRELTALQALVQQKLDKLA